MTNKNTRRGFTRGNKVMLNSFQHLHLDQPLLKEDEILNQVQDDNRRGLTQDYHQINRHPRKLLLGIPTLVKKQGGDPRQNSSWMTANLRGFTLIEILVVVLIIAILVAIALPQYQLAVEKSAAQEALLVLKDSALAQNLYFMEFGSYPTSFDQLDIKIPWTAKGKLDQVNALDTRTNGKWVIGLNDTNPNYKCVIVQRMNGPYAGGMMGIYEQNTSIPSLHQVLCLERKATFPQEGKFCQQLFSVTKITTALDNSFRVYKL